MSFNVGQKVVCVNDTPRFNGGMGTLKKGAVYTIRWLGVADGDLCLRVHEIVRPCGKDSDDCDTPYLRSRFRPVVECTTDTGFAILEEIRRRETVPAEPKQRALTSTMGTES